MEGKEKSELALQHVAWEVGEKERERKGGLSK
jgi:hypothetical protein